MFQLKNRISLRFFFILTLMVMLPLCAMGYGMTAVAERALTSRTLAHMSVVAERCAHRLDAWLSERQADLALSAHLPSLDEAYGQYRGGGRGDARSTEHLMALMDTIFERARSRSSSFDGLLLLDPGGEVIASAQSRGNDKTAHPVKPNLLHEFQRIKGSVYGSVFQLDNHRWCVSLAAGIDDPERERSALIAVLDLAGIIESLLGEPAGLGKTAALYIVDRGRNPDHGASAARYQGRRGREVLGTQARLPGHDLAVVIEVEASEVYQPLRGSTRVWVLTLGLVWLLCLFMAYLVSRRFSIPVMQMAQAAERMADGNLEQRIPFSSRDEVGMLARSFNTMAQQLSQSMAALRQKEGSLQSAYNELMATQARLVQSEKMAAIGELVASVAHEMRAPLTSIKLNLQIIGRSLDRASVRFEHYQIAIHQVTQMERMFTDLLHYSRPLDIKKSSVALPEILEKSVQQLEAELNDCAISVEREMPQELPPVAGDSGKIGQVFVNVLRNAIESSDPTGCIRIAAHSANAGEKPVVVVSVTDYGPGIPQRHLKSIFQPFFTTKKKGTGLGLCIVEKIMNAHHGHIEITSKEGEGTTVRLTFPAA